MAKKKEEKDAESPGPREFGEDERGEKTSVTETETDIFDEVLKGHGKAAAEKLKTASDRNEEGLVDDEDRDVPEEEDEEEEDGNPEPVPEKVESRETGISRPQKRKSVAPLKSNMAKKEEKSEEGEDEEAGKEMSGEEKAEDDDFEFEEGEKKEVAKGRMDEGAQEWNDDEFDYDVDHDSREPDELKASLAPPKDEIK